MEDADNMEDSENVDNSKQQSSSNINDDAADKVDVGLPGRRSVGEDDESPQQDGGSDGPEMCTISELTVEAPEETERSSEEERKSDLGSEDAASESGEVSMVTKGETTGITEGCDAKSKDIVQECNTMAEEVLEEVTEDSAMQDMGDTTGMQETSDGTQMEGMAEDPGIPETAEDLGAQETTGDSEMQETTGDLGIQETNPEMQETGKDVDAEQEQVPMVLGCLYGDCPLTFGSDKETEEHLIKDHMWKEVTAEPKESDPGEVDVEASEGMCKGEKIDEGEMNADIDGGHEEMEMTDEGDEQSELVRVGEVVHDTDVEAGCSEAEQLGSDIERNDAKLETELIGLEKQVDSELHEKSSADVEMGESNEQFGEADETDEIIKQKETSSSEAVKENDEMSEEFGTKKYAENISVEADVGDEEQVEKSTICVDDTGELQEGKGATTGEVDQSTRQEEVDMEHLEQKSSTESGMENVKKQARKEESSTESEIGNNKEHAEKVEKRKIATEEIEHSTVQEEVDTEQKASTDIEIGSDNEQVEVCNPDGTDEQSQINTNREQEAEVTEELSSVVELNLATVEQDDMHSSKILQEKEGVIAESGRLEETSACTPAEQTTEILQEDGAGMERMTAAETTDQRSPAAAECVQADEIEVSAGTAAETTDQSSPAAAGCVEADEIEDAGKMDVEVDNKDKVVRDSKSVEEMLESENCEQLPAFAENKDESSDRAGEMLEKDADSMKTDGNNTMEETSEKDADWLETSGNKTTEETTFDDKDGKDHSRTETMTPGTSVDTQDRTIVSGVREETTSDMTEEGFGETSGAVEETNRGKPDNKIEGECREIDDAVKEMNKVILDMTEEGIRETSGAVAEINRDRSDMTKEGLMETSGAEEEMNRVPQSCVDTVKEMNKVLKEVGEREKQDKPLEAVKEMTDDTGSQKQRDEGDVEMTSIEPESEEVQMDVIPDSKSSERSEEIILKLKSVNKDIQEEGDNKLTVIVEGIYVKDGYNVGNTTGTSDVLMEEDTGDPKTKTTPSSTISKTDAKEGDAVGPEMKTSTSSISETDAKDDGEKKMIGDGTVDQDGGTVSSRDEADSDSSKSKVKGCDDDGDDDDESVKVDVETAKYDGEKKMIGGDTVEQDGGTVSSKGEADIDSHKSKVKGDDDDGDDDECMNIDEETGGKDGGKMKMIGDVTIGQDGGSCSSKGEVESDASKSKVKGHIDDDDNDDECMDVDEERSTAVGDQLLMLVNDAEDDDDNFGEDDDEKDGVPSTQSGTDTQDSAVSSTVAHQESEELDKDLKLVTTPVDDIQMSKDAVDTASSDVHQVIGDNNEMVIKDENSGEKLKDFKSGTVSNKGEIPSQNVDDGKEGKDTAMTEDVEIGSAKPNQDTTKNTSQTCESESQSEISETHEDQDKGRSSHGRKAQDKQEVSKMHEDDDDNTDMNFVVRYVVKTTKCISEDCMMSFTSDQEAEEHYNQVHGTEANNANKKPIITIKDDSGVSKSKSTNELRVPEEKDKAVGSKTDEEVSSKTTDVNKAKSSNHSEDKGVLMKIPNENEIDTKDDKGEVINIPNASKTGTKQDSIALLRCPIVTGCTSEFTSIEAMVKHYRECHKQIECKSCQRSFPSLRMFLAHEATHSDYLKRISFDEETKRFKREEFESKLCDACGELLTTEQAEQYHMHKHKKSDFSEKWFKCMWCVKMFNCQADMEIHATNVLNQFLDSCETCHKSFFLLPEADTHLAQCQQSKEIPCPYGCPKLWFCNEDMREMHYNVVHGKKTTPKVHESSAAGSSSMTAEKVPIGPPVMCQLCNVMFQSGRFKAAHDAVQHSKLEWAKSFKFEVTADGACKIMLKPRRTCPKCGKLCRNDEAYANHQMSHKNWRSYVKNFKCGWCTKTFNSPQALFTHVERVLKRFINLSCGVCGESDDSVLFSDIKHATCDKMTACYCKRCDVYVTDPQCLEVHKEHTHTSAREEQDRREAESWRRHLLRTQQDSQEDDIVELPPPYVPPPPEILIDDDSDDNSDDENSQCSDLSEAPQSEGQNSTTTTVTIELLPGGLVQQEDQSSSSDVVQQVETPNQNVSGRLVQPPVVQNQNVQSSLVQTPAPPNLGALPSIVPPNPLISAVQQIVPHNVPGVVPSTVHVPQSMLQNVQLHVPQDVIQSLQSGTVRPIVLQNPPGGTGQTLVLHNVASGEMQPLTVQKQNIPGSILHPLVIQKQNVTSSLVRPQVPQNVASTIVPPTPQQIQGTLSIPQPTQQTQGITGIAQPAQQNQGAARASQLTQQEQRTTSIAQPAQQNQATASTAQKTTQQNQGTISGVVQKLVTEDEEGSIVNVTDDDDDDDIDLVIDQHDSTAADSSSYVCKFCQTEFVQQSSLMRHVMLMHGKEDEDYACTRCDSKFTSNEELETHEQTHEQTSNKANLKCPFCPRLFEEESQRKEHMAKYHMEENRYVCRICTLTYSNEKSLSLHIKTKKHKEMLKMVKVEKYCQICNLRFSSTQLVISHLKSKAHVAKVHMLRCEEYTDSSTGETQGSETKDNDSEKEQKISGRYPCEACKTSFANKKDFKAHLGTLNHQQNIVRNEYRPKGDQDKTQQQATLNRWALLPKKNTPISGQSPKKTSPSIDHSPKKATADTSNEMRGSSPVVLNVFSLANLDESQRPGFGSSGNTEASQVSAGGLEETTQVSMADSTTGSSASNVDNATTAGNQRRLLTAKYKAKRRRAAGLHCKLCFKIFQDKLALAKHTKLWHRTSKGDSGGKDGKKKEVKKKGKGKKMKKKKNASQGGSTSRVESRTGASKNAAADDDCEIIILDSGDDESAAPAQSQCKATPPTSALTLQSPPASSVTSSHADKTNTTGEGSYGSIGPVLNADAPPDNSDDDIIVLDSDDDSEATMSAQSTPAKSAASLQTVGSLTPQNPSPLQTTSAGEVKFHCNCVGCQESFSSSLKHFIHILSHNSFSSPQRSYKCHHPTPGSGECHQLFEQLYDLLVHIDVTHQKNYVTQALTDYVSSLFKCHHNLCAQVGLSNKNALLTHMRHKHPSGPFICPHCLVSSVDLDWHIKHMDRSHGPKSQWYKEKGKLMNQLQMWVVFNKCHVSTCDKTCANGYEFIMHTLQHQPRSGYKYSFQCSFSSCKFGVFYVPVAHLQHIKQHLKAHNKDFIDSFLEEYAKRTSVCHYSNCTVSAPQPEEFFKHMGLAHKNDSASLVCPHCSHVSLDLKVHMTHMAEQHARLWYNRPQFDAVKKLARSASSTPYICEYKECFRLFKAREVLQNHVLDHFPWHCQNMTCTNPRYMTRELLISHTKSLQVPACHQYGTRCHYARCSAAFVKHVDLVNHEMNHELPIDYILGITGQNERAGSIQGRSYRCSQCNASYATVPAYMIHAITHDMWIRSLIRRNQQHEYVPVRRKALNCQFCVSSFTNDEDVASHEMTHKGKWTGFKCHWCDKVFYSKASLAVHVVLALRTLQRILTRNKTMVSISFKYVDKSLGRQKLTQETKCMTCHVWFNTQASYEKHKVHVHSTATSQIQAMANASLEGRQISQTQPQLQMAQMQPQVQTGPQVQMGQMGPQFISQTQPQVQSAMAAQPTLMQQSAIDALVSQQMQVQSAQQGAAMTNPSVAPANMIQVMPQMIVVQVGDRASPAPTSLTAPVPTAAPAPVFASAPAPTSAPFPASAPLAVPSTSAPISTSYPPAPASSGFAPEAAPSRKPSSDTDSAPELMEVDDASSVEEDLELDQNINSLMSEELTYSDPQGMEIMCEVCFEHFDEMKELKAHMKDIHHVANFKPKPKPRAKKIPVSKYKCKKCPATFTQRTQLKQHKVYHRVIKDFKKKKKGSWKLKYNCKVCHANFDTCENGKIARAAWLGHRHEGRNSPVDCSVCSKHFDNDMVLQFHKIQAHSGGTKQCPKCSKWLVNKKEVFAKHMKEHEIRKCDLCGHSFRNEDALKAHVRKSHKQPTKEKQKSKPISRNERVVLHNCPYCRLKFSKKSLLEIHERQHVQVSLAYLCESCPLRFESVEALMRHQNLAHKKRTFYECSFCMMRFSKDEYLDRHEQTKHGQKPRLQSNRPAGAASTDTAKSANVEKPTSPSAAEKPDEICILETPETKIEMIDIVSSDEEEDDTAPSSSQSVPCVYCNELFKSADDMLKHQISHSKLQIDLTILCKLKLTYGEDKPDGYFDIFD